MNLISLLFKESKMRIILVGFCGIISGSGMTMMMKTIHEAVEASPAVPTGLVWQLVLAACLFLVGNLAANLPLYGLTEAIVFRLRMVTIKQILASDLRHIEKIGQHRVYAALTNDIGRLATGLTNIPGAMINMAMLIGCLFYILLLAWKVVLLFVPFILLLSWIFGVVGKVAGKRFHAARESGDDLFDHFRTVSEGFKELKLNADRRHDFLDNRLEPTANIFRKNRVKGLSAFEIANAFMGLGFFTITGVLIFVFPAMGMVDKHVLSGLVMVFLFIYTPLSKLFELSRNFSQAGVAMRKMESLSLELQKEPIDAVLAPTQPNWQTLELKGVTHTYYNERKDEEFTLGPINLTVHPGEILFITGGNGSGKSTLAKLITALYNPELGALALDGKTIDETNREWFRQHFATVFSDFFLFRDFLGINNSEMRENATRYLEGLHLDHKVTVSDEGLSTTSLSTGQRKRLALMVTYLEDRPIYLFDEWASDQDPQFKKIFYTEILAELKSRGKGVIVISHDDRYFSMADRLVKLDNGQLIEIQDVKGLV